MSIVPYFHPWNHNFHLHITKTSIVELLAYNWDSQLPMCKSHKSWNPDTVNTSETVGRNHSSNMAYPHYATCAHLKKRQLPPLANVLHRQKHNNMWFNRQNKVIHAITNTLLAHPTMRCITLLSVGKVKDKTLDNTIPSWLLPCICYLPKCKPPAHQTPTHSLYPRWPPTITPHSHPTPTSKSKSQNSLIVMKDSPHKSRQGN